MQKILDSIKTNPAYFRTCIQYEVLGRKSPWESYKSFCEKLGDDVMDFLEFEQWFWRFYNGETDLDYDMSTEPKKRTFTDLPTELVTQIAADYLNLVDIITLRQVSKDLQSCCDSLKTNYKTIELCTENNDSTANMTLGGDQYEFRQHENGYIIKKDEVKHHFRNGDYLLDGVGNVLITLFNSKNAKFDDLSFIGTLRKFDYWKNLMEKVSKSLKSNVNVKSLYIDNYGAITCLNQFLPFLTLWQPGKLETIEIHSSLGIGISFELLAETEQWQQAKRANMKMAGQVDPRELQYFLHFDEFELLTDSLSLDDLLELRNNLQKSNNFKKCYIDGKCKFSEDEFADAIESGDGNSIICEHIPQLRGRVQKFIFTKETLVVN